jgi:menaquinone-dependent protoporphyrinogen IX oxidase
MERKRITCPETAHLEEIDLERTPVGLVIHECSRFHPSRDLACTRECAKRMDRRERIDIDAQDRILVIVSGMHAQTTRIGEAIADALRQDGFTAELATLEAGAVPPLEDYDGVVIGAPVRRGPHARTVADYVRAHHDTLTAMPAYLFTVGRDWSLNGGEYVGRLAQRTGWRPTGDTSFRDDHEVPRPQVLELARRIADEIPDPLVVPTLR